ncbi:MAG: TonB-dependent receptor [Microscillaceae bacterium]|nr:TonB-dependent receptor [Microscillaceae bacterium]
MRTLCFFLFFLLLSPLAWGQLVLKGRVQDAQNNSALPGANVQILDRYQATITNEEGQFQLNRLPQGALHLRVSFVGYAPQTLRLDLQRDTSLLIALSAEPFVADEVVVRATRLDHDSPMAFTNLSRAELQSQNLGQDLPILLNFTPSVVSTSDAGAGVGYTGLRIRGSDPTRTNVTINGIPLNDAESQGVFWVNLPDFASSVEDLQIQRGVGTSTNGAGAFGATLNIQTNRRHEKAFAEISQSFGSFNTWRHTLSAGTGLLNEHFSLEGRLSKISSDGFIDRAFADLKSFYVSGAYYGRRTTLQANVFSGAEQTFQAWYGVPEARLQSDLVGIENFITRNSLNINQAQNLRQSDARRYNAPLYDNETDNYQQDHYQFFLNQKLGANWLLNTALHYTRGRGYFEQYRYEDALADYGLPPVSLGESILETSDLIRRLWLNNHFYGLVFSLQHQGQKAEWTLGGSVHQYRGRHFGEIIWMRWAGQSNIRERYYENEAIKGDVNLYGKVDFALSTLWQGFVDVQYRGVRYDFLGNARDSQGVRNVQQLATLHFFNPKAGLTFRVSSQSDAYFSVAVAHREPNRDDYTQSTPENRPRPERLYDLETGYRHQAQNWNFKLNAYGMFYKDQLVLTGQVNDVGNYNRSNVENSYRIGLEAEGQWQLSPHWQINANATLSRNKIRRFREYLDLFGETEDAAYWQTQGYTLEEHSGQFYRMLSQTDLAFSPSLIAAARLSYRPIAGLEITWLSKYVGRQFLDNTASELRQLDGFATQDLRLRYQFSQAKWGQLELTFLLNNLLATRYEPNGYTYGYLLGQTRIDENFYFPQAGRHFLAGLRIFVGKNP